MGCLGCPGATATPPDLTALGELRSAPDERVVLLDRREHVATLTLNRPAAHNAINLDLIRALRASCRELEADDQVWAVIVRLPYNR